MMWCKLNEYQYFMTSCGEQLCHKSDGFLVVFICHRIKNKWEYQTRKNVIFLPIYHLLHLSGCIPLKLSKKVRIIASSRYLKVKVISRSNFIYINLKYFCDLCVARMVCLQRRALLLLPPANEVWGKVIFSETSVILSIWGGEFSVWCHFLSGCMVPCSL